MMLMMPTAPSAQRDDAHAAEKNIHGVEDGADHVFFLNGVPFVEGVFERGVEAVPLGNHTMHCGLCGHNFAFCGGLVLD